MSELTDPAQPREYRLVKHTAIAPDGSIHRRTSIHRNYTHAVIKNDTNDGWIVLTWHETAADAQDSLDRLSRTQKTAATRFRITGVTRMDSPELFTTQSAVA